MQIENICQKLTFCHSVVPQNSITPHSGSSLAFLASVELPLDPFSAGLLEASMATCNTG